jgi:hypothetical protein
MADIPGWESPEARGFSTKVVEIDQKNIDGARSRSDNLVQSKASDASRVGVFTLHPPVILHLVKGNPS